MEGPGDTGTRRAGPSQEDGVLGGTRMCDSPRHSISEGGHSDVSTLTEKVVTFTEEPESITSELPQRPKPGRSNGRRRRRQDSWMSDQLSPTGTYHHFTGARRSTDPTFTAGFPFTESPLDERFSSSVPPIPGSSVAVPIHHTCPQKKDIKPCFPTERNRYDRKVVVAKNEQVWEFEPLQTFTVHDVYCDERWLPSTHPEGQLYFTSSRRDDQWLFVTEENLFEKKNVDEIEAFVEAFASKASALKDQLPLEMEIFVSFDEWGDEGWYYYCVDSDRRCLFWIDKVDLTWMAEKVGSVPSKAHFKYGLDYEYWIHVEHFPFHQTIPDSLIHDLMGVAIHSSVDVMTSLDSTVPYSQEETQQLVGLVKHLHTLKKSKLARGYLVVAAARLMTIFVNERFYHFAGQHGAKLTRDQSIRGEQPRRTFLIKLVSPFLFWAPETHLKSLEKIYIDGTIKKHPWKIFVTRLEEDWVQYVLYSTVLLTADVSFMAVPNVMPNNGIPAGQPAPAAVVATQISLIAAMGSIVIGLLLVRDHRKKSAESAESAADFLARRSHRSRGLEALAILYSLPYALLMWGMLSFLAGLAIICFVFAVNGLVPSILYIVVWVFVLALILFTIIAQLEASLDVNWRDFPVFKLLRRKKKNDDSDGAEMNEKSDAFSVTSNSSRAGKTRIRLDFFMRRKRDSRRDTVYPDLERQ